MMVMAVVVVSIPGLGVGLPWEDGEDMDVEVGVGLKPDVGKGMVVIVRLTWEVGEGTVVEVELQWEDEEGTDVGMGLPWVGGEESNLGHQKLAQAVEWGPDASVYMHAEWKSVQFLKPLASEFYCFSYRVRITLKVPQSHVCKLHTSALPPILCRFDILTTPTH